MSDVWSGIYSSLDTKKPCNICGDIKGVKHKVIKVQQGGCVKSLSTHVQSSICANCHNQGWVVFSEADPSGKITYYNLQTEEFSYLE